MFDHVDLPAIAQRLRDALTGQDAYLPLGIGAPHEHQYRRPAVDHDAFRFQPPIPVPERLGLVVLAALPHHDLVLELDAAVLIDSSA
ncbi:MAG: hypothetical protein ACYTE6_13390, partial [Planctomycetota bacterium]